MSQTVTQTFTKLTRQNTAIWEVSIIASSSGGSVSDISMTAAVGAVVNGMYLQQVITTPDASTGPTASYDMTLSTAASMDIMGGALGSLSNSAQEIAFPSTSSISGPVLVPSGNLTLKVTNNSVNSAGINVRAYFVRA